MKICCWVFIACVLVSCKESDLFPNSAKKKEKKVILDGPSKVTLNERVKVQTKKGVLDSSIRSYDLVIVDKNERELKTSIEAYDGKQVLVFRQSDGKRFLIQMDALSEKSKDFIVNKGEFNKPYLANYLNYKEVIDKYDKAKKIINIDVLINDKQESEKAIEFLRKEKIRFYTDKLTGVTAKDKSMLKEWGVASVPAFKIGEEIIEGFDKAVILDKMVLAYDKKKR